MRFGEKKVAKEELCSGKNPIKIWDVDVNNIAISKWFKQGTALCVWLDVQINLWCN